MLSPNLYLPLSPLFFLPTFLSIAFIFHPILSQICLLMFVFLSLGVLCCLTCHTLLGYISLSILFLFLTVCFEYSPLWFLWVSLSVFLLVHVMVFWVMTCSDASQPSISQHESSSP
jgi:hypothetical protein